MLIISHRGNLDGPSSVKENSPDAIEKAKSLGFDVEVDLWVVDGEWWLGHDTPEWKVEKVYLYVKSGLWIHCKNLESFIALSEELPENNFFWHENDKYTLTSNGKIWAYPGQPVDRNCIAVLPEGQDTDLGDAYGVCTDYPLVFK